MKDYKDYIEYYEESFLKDLDSLIRIASVSDESNPVSNEPFGKNVADCFKQFSVIADRLGFEVENDDGYAISANVGSGSDYIGILGHLDVVEAQQTSLWKYSPYKLTIEDGILYGRGVSDDKGPLLANLYAVRILRDMGYKFNLPVRIIAGGAEETTWNCMKHYFENHSQPIMGYSPDGNFPIVNGELGILTIRVELECNPSVQLVCLPLGYYTPNMGKINKDGKELVFEGKSALTRHPERSDNPIFKLADYVMNHSYEYDNNICVLAEDIIKHFKDPYGKDCSIYYEDSVMGKTTVSIFNLKSSKNGYGYDLDIRYPKGCNASDILKTISNLVQGKCSVIREKRCLYVDSNSELIKKLSSAYENIMNEKPSLLIKSGASYARVLDCGVAFGATFGDYDTKIHMPNENIRLKDLQKAMEIYCDSIRLLACK